MSTALKIAIANCPRCAKGLVDGELPSDEYYMCDVCAVIWHDQCALEIFSESAAKKEVHCKCPACGGPWKYTHFENRTMKETNTQLMQKIEEMSHEISLLQAKHVTYKLIEETSQSVKEENKQLRRDVGKILDMLSIAEKTN